MELAQKTKGEAQGAEPVLEAGALSLEAGAKAGDLPSEDPAPLEGGAPSEGATKDGDKFLPKFGCGKRMEGKPTLEIRRSNQPRKRGSKTIHANAAENQTPTRCDIETH